MHPLASPLSNNTLFFAQLVTSNMELNQKQSLPEKDTDKSSIDDQVKKQKSEVINEIVADDEIVPIVIRPGHIRFEPLGKGGSLSLSLLLVCALVLMHSF